MDTYRVILIMHLFGLAFGLGGAAMLDTIMLVACRRSRVSRDLVELLHAGSRIVVGAMVILATSGIAFFVAGAQATPKFWAKMAIVFIACANGVAAHRLIFPWLMSATQLGPGRVRLPLRRARIAAASAAISSVSWSAALILGAWRGLAIGIAPILAVYTLVLCLAISVSVIVVAPSVFDFSDRTTQEARLAPNIRSKRSLAVLPDAVVLAVTNNAQNVAGRLHRWGSSLRTTGRWTMMRRDANGS